MPGIVQRIGLFDIETGESLDTEVLFIGRNPKYKDRGYVKVFTAFLSDIVESDKLAGKSIRLLFYMLETMDYNTLTIKVIRKDALERLKITKDTYHRWVRDLIEYGILEKVDRYTYKLKPYTAIKGSHEKATQLSLKGQGQSQ